MSDLKLFFVIDDGNSSITLRPNEIEIYLNNMGMEGYSSETPSEDLPVFTVSPVYMTQEEFKSMPEWNG